MILRQLAWVSAGVVIGITSCFAVPLGVGVHTPQQVTSSISPKTAPRQKVSTKVSADASSVQPEQESAGEALNKKSLLSKIEDWFNKPSRHKTINEMDFDELKKGKERHLAQGNISLALRYLDKMIPLCPNLYLHADLLFEQASMLMKLEDYQRAAAVFTEFSTLYPSHVHAEEASFRAVQCQARLILSHDRDQTVTLQTLELAQEFLERSQVFTQYRAEVEKIAQDCVTHLIKSECSVAEFYMKQKNFSPAQRRLSMVREQFLEKAPQAEPMILDLECALAKRQGNTELFEEKKMILAEKLPVASRDGLGLNASAQAHKSFAQRF